MNGMIDGIDSFVGKLAAAAFWGIIRGILKRVRLLLLFEGEREGAEILDIIAG